MYFKCKLDEKFNNIFETDISTLDKSRYHVDCSVEVNWSDELEKDLPTIVFSLTRDMLYVKEIKRLYFDNYDELLKYIFDEKKFLEKGKYTFPLFSNDLNPAISESVWTNGAKYGYYICNLLAGGKDYLKVVEKVGNWDEFRNKFLEVRKKYV